MRKGREKEKCHMFNAISLSRSPLARSSSFSALAGPQNAQPPFGPPRSAAGRPAAHCAIAESKEGRRKKKNERKDPTMLSLLFFFFLLCTLRWALPRQRRRAARQKPHEASCSGKGGGGRKRGRGGERGRTGQVQAFCVRSDDLFFLSVFLTVALSFSSSLVSLAALRTSGGAASVISLTHCVLILYG